MQGKIFWRLSLLAILILTNYLVWLDVSEATSSNLRVDILNVGQGDAILIRTPTHQNILVDGGPDDTVVAELGKILPVWDHNLDLVVATHLDADHISGLVTVLERYQVKEVLTAPPHGSTTKVAAAWQQAVLKVSEVNYGDAADDYRWGEVVWDTLLPVSSENISADTNNASIVAKLTYRGIDMLLTGDMEAPAENLLMQIYPAISTEVLKVAHHGSKFSSTSAFLEMLDPEVALISVGKNSYGHPSSDTLGRLQAVGADIYRTDQSDTIEMIFGDNGYSIKANGQKEFYPHS